MKIGIFLGYGPQVRLGTEGLGRYIGGLIKGFTKMGIDTTIALPKWLLPSMENLLSDLDISKDHISFLSNKRESFVWIIYKKLVLDKKRRSPFGELVQKIVMQLLLHSVRMSASIPAFLFIVAGFLLFLFAIIAFPVVAIVFLLLFIYRKIMDKVHKKTGRLTRGKINKDQDKLYMDVFYEMSNAVIDILIKKVNRDHNVDIWYVPSLFWPQVKKIKRPVVINAPDLVTAEFPVAFAGKTGMSAQTDNVKKTIYGGKYFITYSEFIRRNLLIRDFGKDPEKVVAIRHVNNTSKPFVDISTRRGAKLNSSVSPDLLFCRELVNRLVSHSSPDGYCDRKHLENVQYLFYASQIRPHKNLINLFRAVEYLIRQRGIPIKLFITGFIDKEIFTDEAEYLYEHHLQCDIISFPNVSTQELSALYRCAQLVVNPSMYEGGFTFTFGEGMSVGTPSLMADVPFETDELIPAGLERAVFNPINWREIAEKIEYWLPRRDELYQMELPLYQKFEKRTPEVVAKEYIEAFDRFMRIEQEKRA